MATRYGQQTNKRHLRQQGELWRRGRLFEPHKRNVLHFYDAEAGWIDRPDGGLDSTYLLVDAGASTEVSQRAGLCLTLPSQEEDVDEGGVDIDRVEAGLGLIHQTVIPFFGKDHDKTISGFARIARDSSSDGVEDDVISFGADFRTYASANVYLDAGIQRFTRSSSDPFFDDEDTILAIIAGWEF